MRRLSIPFDYLKTAPVSFEDIHEELLDGIAASQAQFGEMFGGKSALPAIDGYETGRDAGIGDAEHWFDSVSALPLDQQTRVLGGMPIYGFASLLWEYAIESHWSPRLADEPQMLFHHVAAFCELARFASEFLSIGTLRMPIGIERLYARSHARLMIDATREPSLFRDTDDFLEDLSIEDVALLGELAPQSVRNAFKAKGSARLPAKRVKGVIQIEPAEAQAWLLGRKRYVPTDLSTFSTKGLHQ